MPILLLFIAFSGVLQGVEFCAVKVYLTDEHGKPVSALVELKNHSGEVVERNTAPRGEADFCDFGFGEHSIVIGGTTCSQIVIPHVRVFFGQTQVFREYINKCSGSYGMSSVCRVYFRVTSESDIKLSNVAVTSEPPGIDVRTDQYGRAQVKIPEDESRVVTFSKSGYLPAQIVLSCSKPNYSERSIVMHSSNY